jgi:hypothetical protein
VLGPAWGWPVDTGTHVLRLICGGVFDRYPNLKIIIGHLGELLPYCYARLSLAITIGRWLLDQGGSSPGGSSPQLQKSFAYYMKHNIYITSSGTFEQPVFDCALAMIGIDNLMFSVDSPLRDSVEAVEFLAACNLMPLEKERFAHGTAEKLLPLAPADSDGRRPATCPTRRLASSAAVQDRPGPDRCADQVVGAAQTSVCVGLPTGFGGGSYVLRRAGAATSAASPSDTDE